MSVPINDETQLVLCIRNALHAKAGDVQKCVQEWSSFCYKNGSGYPPFSNDALDDLLALISSESSHASDHVNHLLLLLEYEWGRFSEQQRQQILEVIKRVYARVSDFSRFIISELLGEYFCDAAAFDALCQFSESTNADLRKFAPHGFEHIFRGCVERALRVRAYKKLKLLAADPSSGVRTEVAEALRNIARAGEE